MERVLHDSVVGWIETLADNQKFERFLDMESCEAHFYKVEAGEIPLMLPGAKINNASK